MFGRYFYNNSLGLAHGGANLPDPPEYDFIDDDYDDEEDPDEEDEGDDD